MPAKTHMHRTGAMPRRNNAPVVEPIQIPQGRRAKPKSRPDSGLEGTEPLPEGFSEGDRYDLALLGPDYSPLTSPAEARSASTASGEDRQMWALLEEQGGAEGEFSPGGFE